MTVKHTPGPWVAEESEIFAAAGDAVRIAETVPLADDPQDVPGFGRTELANARLIAAAPELLKALHEAAGFIERYEQPIESAARSYWLRVRDVTSAAIAKAEATSGTKAGTEQ